MHSRILAFFGCVSILGLISAEDQGATHAGLDVSTVQEFDRQDRNRDHSLDLLEFAFTEVGQRVREATGKLKGVERVFAKVDADASGGIELLEFAQSQHNRNARLLERRSSAKYASFDLDQDGLIALDEYLARANAKAETFGNIDLNSNDIVGPFEWAQALRDEFMPKEVAGKFAKLDSDDSGAIDRIEFDASPDPGDLHRIDLNGNQQISPQEFAKADRQPAGRAGIAPDVEAVFMKLDRNRDGAISRREFSRSELAERSGDRKIEFVFDRHDADRDGELSLNEFGKLRPPPPEMRGKGKGKGKFKAKPKPRGN